MFSNKVKIYNMQFMDLSLKIKYNPNVELLYKIIIGDKSDNICKIQNGMKKNTALTILKNGRAFEADKKIISIKEKPKKFISNDAITGLYFFDKNVVNYAKKLKPSKRGELEIIDLLMIYKNKNKLRANFIGRGGAWLDTGSIDDYYKTIAFVQAVENRQGLKIACIEEIALLNEWINKEKIKRSIKFYGKCQYSDYLKKLLYK